MYQKSRCFFSPLLGILLLLGSGQIVQAALVTRVVNVNLNASNLDTFNLDFDLSGTSDFNFGASFIPDPVLTIGFDVVNAPFGSSNGVVIDAFSPTGAPNATRLNVGDFVSSGNLFSSASFDQANLFSFVAADPSAGNFEGQTGYVGIRFDSIGGSLYGFAEVTVNGRNDATNPFGLTIGTIGYNDSVGQPVQISAIPEPTSFAMVAIGALGIASSRYRRKRKTLLSN